MLVYERDPHVIDVLRAVLDFVEWDVLVADSLTEVASAFNPPPAAVLIHAPEAIADWERVVELARSAPLPVRLGLAVDEPADAHEETRRIGIDRVFLKPLDMDELMEWLAIN